MARALAAVLAVGAVGAAVALGAAALAAGACRGSVASPVTTPARVDRLFRRFTAGASPGCAVAVVADGKVALARGYGFADLSRRLPITPRTVFDIASTSKQFTAACVLLLAARGRLSLDEDIRRYVPELPRHDAVITLGQLLHHTSGLPNYIDLLVKAGKRYDEVTTDDDALAALAGAPDLEFPPGTAYHYNDSGYFLLSLVVKRVSGRSLRQFAAENLFAPLGMADTRIVDDDGEEVPRRALPYSPAAGGGFQTEATRWEQTGDGGVNTTVLDLAKWAASFDSPGTGKEALVAAMTTPGRLADGTPLGYAGGLFLDSFHGERRVRHPGSWRGWSAELMRLPDRRLSVITLCNRDDADPAALSEQVADLYLEAGR
ncbi:MAG TPA: serine hydrolase domain-containing protein [Thermoanaerobaculia bacterium]|nr:serine hydrolase domain-containing protein [Thermoanaerobaculia bacterium]